jgi:hypothetical protein
MPNIFRRVEYASYIDPGSLMKAGDDAFGAGAGAAARADLPNGVPGAAASSVKAPDVPPAPSLGAMGTGRGVGGNDADEIAAAAAHARQKAPLENAVKNATDPALKKAAIDDLIAFNRAYADTLIKNLTESSSAASKNAADSAKLIADATEAVSGLRSAMAAGFKDMDEAAKTALKGNIADLKKIFTNTVVSASDRTKFIDTFMKDLTIDGKPIKDAQELDGLLKNLGYSEKQAKSLIDSATESFKKNGPLFAKIGAPLAAIVGILFIIFDTKDAAKIVSALTGKALEVTGADNLIDWFTNTFGDIGGKIVGAISGFIIGSILIYIVFILIKSLSSSSSAPASAPASS